MKMEKIKEQPKKLIKKEQKISSFGKIQYIRNKGIAINKIFF